MLVHRRAGVLDAKRFFIFPLGLDNSLAFTREEDSVTQQDDRNVILVYLQIKNLLLQVGLLGVKKERRNQETSERADSGWLQRWRVR